MKKQIIAGVLLVSGVALFSREIRLKMGPYYGHFSPKEKIIQTIYGKGAEIYGARMGLTLKWNVSLWLTYLQYRVIGKTSFSNESTTMALNPVTVSIRFTAPFDFFVLPYAAAGYTFMDFKEESIIGRISGKGRAATFDFGIEARASSRLFFDFGMRFNSLKVKPGDVSIDVGGFQYGASLTIAF